MTLSPSDWELLHRAVDGETTEAESAGLRKRLVREPELAVSHQALLGVGRTLSEVGLADPPAELAGDVMRQVRQQQAAARGGGFSGLTGWVSRQPGLALAASLVVGLLTGLFITGLSGRGVLLPLDEQAVSGTILPSGHLAALPVIDEARLEGPGIQATALLRRGREAVVAELEIAVGGAVDVTVEVDETALRPRGFECLGGEPAGGVVIESGRVQVRRAPAGRCFVSLAVLNEGPSPVSVRMQAGAGRAEVTLHSGTLAE